MDNPRDPRRWRALGVLCASLFLTGVDLTALHVAVPALGRALLPGGTELLWIVDSYPLTMAALLLTFGTLADRWGRKRMVLGGFAVFGLASAAAALAPDTPTLIGARVALGVGAAMMMAATAGIIRAIFPDARERGAAMGLWTAANSVGAAAGPLLGGLLVQHWYWGAVFWLNVPVAFAALLAGPGLLPESRDPAPRRWDVAGALLAAVGLAAVVVAVKRIAHELSVDGWSAVALVAGVALLVLFVRRQRRVSAPLLEPALFADRRVGTAVVAVFGCFGCYAALLFFATQFLQFVAGYPADRAGLALVPLALASAAGAALGPRLTARWPVRWLLAVSLAGCAVAFGGIGALLRPGPPGVALLGGLVLAGSCMGAVLALASDLLMSSVTAERAGAAGAVQETAFELGSGLGIAVLGSALGLAYRAGLPGRASESLADALAVPGDGALHAAARAAFTDGLAVLCPLIGAGLLALACFVPLRLRTAHPRPATSEDIAARNAALSEDIAANRDHEPSPTPFRSGNI